MIAYEIRVLAERVIKLVHIAYLLAFVFPFFLEVEDFNLCLCECRLIES